MIAEAVNQALDLFIQRGGTFQPNLAAPILQAAHRLTQALRMVGGTEQEQLAEHLERYTNNVQDEQGLRDLVIELDYVIQEIQPFLSEENRAVMEQSTQNALASFDGNLQDALQEPPDLGEFPLENAPQLPSPTQSPGPSPGPPPTRQPPPSTQTAEPGTPRPRSFFSKGAIIALSIGVPLFLLALVIGSQILGRRDDDDLEDGDIQVLNAEGKVLHGAARSKALRKARS